MYEVKVKRIIKTYTGYIFSGDVYECVYVWVCVSVCVCVCAYV